MKKILSILLAMCLLVSLCTIAVSTASAADTSANVIKYDFDNATGIAYNRYSGGVSYVDGALKLQNKTQGGGVYFAKDPNYATVHAHTNAAAYDKMLALEPNTEYKITLDYKVLAGSTNFGMHLLFATNATSTTPEKATYKLVKKYYENVTSVKYDAALEADTEVKNAEFMFTVGANSVNVGIYISTGNVNVLIDNVVIEKVAVKATNLLDLDFESQKAEGIAGTFYDNEWNNKFTKSSDGFGAMLMVQNQLGGNTLWFAKDTTVNKDATTIPKITASDTDAAEKAANLLELKPSTTYRITFKYRYRDDSIENTSIEFMIAINPYASTNHGRGENLSSVVETYIDGNDTKATDETFGGSNSTWHNWRYETIIFTTKDKLTNKYLGMRNPYSTKGKQAAMFDFISIDEIELPETADKELQNVGSIREESNEGDEYVSAGIRFRASVSEDFRASATEIGFYAAPTAALNGGSLADYIATEDNLAVSVKVMADGMEEIVYGTSTDAYGRKTYDYQLIITRLTREGVADNLLDTKITAVMYAIVDGEMVFSNEISYCYNDIANK